MNTSRLETAAMELAERINSRQAGLADRDRFRRLARCLGVTTQCLLDAAK